VRPPANLFGVSTPVYEAINRWLVREAALAPDERTPAGVFPDQFNAPWRVAAQAAFARAWMETPYLLLAGAAALVVLPLLVFLSWVCR